MTKSRSLSREACFWHARQHRLLHAASRVEAGCGSKPEAFLEAPVSRPGPEEARSRSRPAVAHRSSLIVSLVTPIGFLTTIEFPDVTL